MSARPGPAREPELLSSDDDALRLTERWTALPQRLRRVVAGGAAAALVAAGSAYLVASRPEPAPPPPVAYPAQVTTITFANITKGDAGENGFTIELYATTTGGSPVSVEGITQGYASLDLRLDPPPPIVITVTRPRKLIVRAHVSTCRGLPLEAGMPFLDVTLRNSRAKQELSVIPGRRYALALTRQLRTLCGPSAAEPSPTA